LANPAWLFFRLRFSADFDNFTSGFATGSTFAPSASKNEYFNIGWHLLDLLDHFVKCI
jgi:hypothetical protein